MNHEPRFATRGERRIHFTETGAGPPLVLLPGLGSGMKLFGTLPRRFARVGFRVLCFDPVGVAPSTPLDGPFRFADAAADVVAVLDTAGIATAHLVGTSLGGKVALQVAADAPERIARIALLASSAVVSARAQRVYRFFRAVASELSPAAFADAVAPFLFGTSFHNERSAVVDDIVRATRPDPHLRRLMVAQAEALATFDGATLAATIRAATLCAAGLEDTLTDPRDVRATAALLAASEYVEFPSAGHSLLLEDARVFDAVVAFLHATSAASQ